MKLGNKKVAFSALVGFEEFRRRCLCLVELVVRVELSVREEEELRRTSLRNFG